ncbi:nucleolar protein dao-5-like [Haliotis cracherodii]|uniref:nucleolar protein dao-5-like n=1 Tax=Haliotis cracherodii TaxID=6455 RepID=UPI0039EB8092
MMDNYDPVAHPGVWIFGISAVILLPIVVFICIRRKKRRYTFLGSMDIATVFGQITADAEDNTEMRSNEPDPSLCASGASAKPAPCANKRESTASGSSMRSGSKSCFVNQQPAVNMGGCRQKSKSTFHATLRDFNPETGTDDDIANYSKPNRGRRSDYEAIYLKNPKRDPNKSRPLPPIHPSQLKLTEAERASLPENALRRMQTQSLTHCPVSNLAISAANHHQSNSAERVPKNLSKTEETCNPGNDYKKNTLPMAKLSKMAGRPLPPIQMAGMKPAVKSDNNSQHQEIGEKRLKCAIPDRPEELAASANESLGNPARPKGSPSAKKKKHHKKQKAKKPVTSGNKIDGNINKPQVTKEDSPKILKPGQDCSSSGLESPQQAYALKYITDKYTDAPKNQQIGYQRSNILKASSAFAPCSSNLSTTNNTEKNITQPTPSGSDKSSLKQLSPRSLTVEGRSHQNANLFAYFSEDITLPSNELVADLSRSALTEEQPKAINLMKPNDKIGEDATVELLTQDVLQIGPPIAKVPSMEQPEVDDAKLVLNIHNSDKEMSKKSDKLQGIASDTPSLGVPSKATPKDGLSAVALEKEPELKVVSKDVLETKIPVPEVLKSTAGDTVSVKSSDIKAPLAREEINATESDTIKKEMQPNLRRASEGKK